MIGFVLNPLSDGFSAELDLHDRVGYHVIPPADLAPPNPNPTYVSSYDTEGSIAADEAHYDNRQIGLRVRVVGDTASEFESRLNALYHMIGQINREGGVLEVTTPNETVCYFDLVQQATATAAIDFFYEERHWTFVDLSLAARPFWRGPEVLAATYEVVTV